MALYYIPPTQNSAPVFKFDCLYTHDIKRKQKRWQDGVLCFHTFNKRVMVYEAVSNNFIGDTHWSESGAVQDGDELKLDRGVIVNVGEQTDRKEQDLTELFSERRPGKAHSPIQPAAARSGIARLWNEKAPPLPVQKPKSLKSVLGTFGTQNGRANRGLQPVERSETTEQSRREEELLTRPSKKPRLGGSLRFSGEGTYPNCRVSTGTTGVEQRPHSFKLSNHLNPLMTVASDDDAPLTTSVSSFETPIPKLQSEVHHVEGTNESPLLNAGSWHMKKKSSATPGHRQNQDRHIATNQPVPDDSSCSLLKAGRPKRKKLIFQDTNDKRNHAVSVALQLPAASRFGREKIEQRVMTRPTDLKNNEIKERRSSSSMNIQDRGAAIEGSARSTKEILSLSKPPTALVRPSLRTCPEELNMAMIDRNLLSRSANPRRSPLKKAITLPISKRIASPTRQLIRSKSDISANSLRPTIEDSELGPWSREAFDLFAWTSEQPKAKNSTFIDQSGDVD